MSPPLAVDADVVRAVDLDRPRGFAADACRSA
jgi:hypothetical protein